MWCRMIFGLTAIQTFVEYTNCSILVLLLFKCILHKLIMIIGTPLAETFNSNVVEILFERVLYVVVCSYKITASFFPWGTLPINSPKHCSPGVNSFLFAFALCSQHPVALGPQILKPYGWNFPLQMGNRPWNYFYLFHRHIFTQCSIRKMLFSIPRVVL